MYGVLGRDEHRVTIVWEKGYSFSLIWEYVYL